MVDAHEAHRQARRARPAQPGWNRPTTPWRFSPVRMSRILGLAVVSILTLSDGTSGTPRQVTNGVPNNVTVGGGTPRRVHSRPNAAMARGWARKKLGSFHTFVSSSSRSSGVGGPVRVRMRCDGATLARARIRRC